MLPFSLWGHGEIGRRRRFKTSRPRGHAGSSPAVPTKILNTFMKFLRELLEGDVLNFGAAKRRRDFKQAMDNPITPDDIPEPLRRAATDLKASRASVSNFDAAKRRKEDQTDAGRFRKAAAHLKDNPREFPPRPKASVDKLPLRTRNDVTVQIRKVLKELDTSFTWVDNHTAVAYYNPADYVRAVQAFDQLFGSRHRAGKTTYMWNIDDVEVSFAIETRRLVIEIV